MRKLYGTLFLVVVLALIVPAATVAAADPVGSCPPGFVLHPAMQHDHEPGHRHVGTDTDHNGDGWICVKHVTLKNGTEVHVHIDNVLPLS